MIKKTFEFEDFKQAWQFLTDQALFADEIDHHAEWFNVYNRVEVLLSSHWCNALTFKDVLTAYTMEYTNKRIVDAGDSPQIGTIPQTSSEQFYELIKPH